MNKVLANYLFILHFYFFRKLSWHKVFVMQLTYLHGQIISINRQFIGPLVMVGEMMRCMLQKLTLPFLHRVNKLQGAVPLPVFFVLFDWSGHLAGSLPTQVLQS